MLLGKPYLIFLGDVVDAVAAKTGFGARDWAPQDCLGQWRMPECRVNLGLPEMGPVAAAANGARSLLIGIAPPGGRIPEAWGPALREAVEAGLNIISGMHTRLEDIEGLVTLAGRHKVRLINVRSPPKDLPIGTGVKRTGKRLLTVGTDCALGKKYTALTIAKALQLRGIAADFRATGQTGIIIAGSGVPLDCVVADFISGAIEQLTPEASADHWDVIEGQGSLFHPGYAGVTLGLVHGAQPDALILCHDPTRKHILNNPHMPMPALKLAAARYLEAAQLTNSNVKLVGVSLNTSALSQAECERALSQAEHELGVPSFDPLKTSAEAVIGNLLAQ
ncbi:DUF1611 domain-containing protein [Steroidobacter agaridevorans]|uniref:DUF1611 domain-containing protein n=1 Tax=Steroidobacter agaridevorans TaxID=2695856 RepID=UPI001322F18C|nr:DUF1611 domain-containing protein [Steroidobacter agaridevorans]GFE91908.1 hypothetical protein GCM10011488_68620 [Steroidobacter agaridevorans]